jgi:hypothetical protein
VWGFHISKTRIRLEMRVCVEDYTKLVNHSLAVLTRMTKGFTLLSWEKISSQTLGVKASARII